MIVAKADSGQIIVGITPADIEVMKTGRTCVKQGNPQYGFRSLIVFMGDTNEALVGMLNAGGAVRHDDLFRDTGTG